MTMTMPFRLLPRLPRKVLRPLAQLCLALFAAPLLSALAPQEAKANVVCLINTVGLDMGTSTTGSGSINWTCTNYTNQQRSFTLCVGLGFPSWPGIPAQPILRRTSGFSFIFFNVYRNPTFTTIWTASQPLTQGVTIPGGIGNSVSGSFPFYAARAGGTVAGQYEAFFYNTVLGMMANGNCQERTTIGGQRHSGQQFTLPITAGVQNSCDVSALGDANLGSVPSTGGAVSGSTTISVTCPSGTPYNIGLAPSNGNTAGLGALTGTGGNTDQPPYQLRRNSVTGPIWGNTASTSGPGNGVGGTGNGAAQNYPVFVTVPGSNYAPDDYSDTVTVTVHY